MVILEMNYIMNHDCEDCEDKGLIHEWGRWYKNSYSLWPRLAWRFCSVCGLRQEAQESDSHAPPVIVIIDEKNEKNNHE